MCRLEEASGETAEEEFSLLQVPEVSGGMSTRPPIKVQVGVDDCLISMEVDTGASMSLMSDATFNKLWPGRSLSTTSVRLNTYSKEAIPVVGCTEVQVAYEGQRAQLPLIVVRGEGPTLLGRNWLEKIVLDWSKIHYIPSAGLQGLLGKYPEVFEEGRGTLQGVEAKIQVDPNATPVFCRARTVPYAMRELVDEELSRLVAEGTLEPVESADWAAPIVAVLKPDKKSVRICGDFKMTVNPVSKLDRYPIPRAEDIFALLEKGKTFSKLDLSQAYLQVPLDAESRQYVVINTQRGLFRYTRLPYEIASAPGIFQRTMEKLLHGILGVAVYIDDVLISAKTEEEHLKILEEVLKRLARAGLRLKKHKCQFMSESVDYLGHGVDAAGLHPLPDKVQAVKDAPTPTNVAELRSYLGLLTYYGKFLPNLATLLNPLYKLLGKGVPWQWQQPQEKAFQDSKALLSSSKLLTHFDPKLPLTLACDASAYGIGAVLAHKRPDGSEKPIGYASRTLNKAERNYSQLEKEGLSCIFGVKRFYAYLFGHHFELVTDHKPLLGLLGEHKQTSPQASARVRRWSLYLAMFEYTLKFRGTKAHANADALSRLPLPVEPASTEKPPELVLLAEHMSESPVTAEQIRAWTRKDPELAPVVEYLRHGWPGANLCQDRPALTPYLSRQSELSLEEGCV